MNIRDFQLPKVQARPPRQVADGLGTILQAGQLVQFQSEVALIFEIVNVTLSMQPQPDGREYMQVMVQAQFPIMIPTGVKAPRLLVVRQAMADAGKNGQPTEPSRIALTDAAEPPSSPSSSPLVADVDDPDDLP